MSRMRNTQRPRRYMSKYSLALMRPLLRYSTTREAYVLRVAGRRLGPVLRQDRRRGQGTYDGPERRSADDRGARA
jgi:hypothetical protein